MNSSKFFKQVTQISLIHRFWYLADKHFNIIWIQFQIKATAATSTETIRIISKKLICVIWTAVQTARQTVVVCIVDAVIIDV